ncbi:MAG: GNAT family N-acetyltransferase, partial [Myxococcota bacterium]
MSSRQGILAIPDPSEADCGAVEALARVCRHRDELALPLYPAEARTSPTEIGLFLYYVDDQLAGFVSLYPGESDVELLGMVHPDRRRKGIGRALLDAARHECRRRGAKGLLLVCEETAVAAQEFARTVGGEHEFSEHKMQLDREQFARGERPRPPGLRISSAAIEDIERLIAIRVDSFGGSEERARSDLERWLHDPRFELLIANRGSEAIGMLRVSRFESEIFLNGFAVVREHRGRGVGHELLVAVLERLATERGKSIALEVETDNHSALSLY